MIGNGPFMMESPAATTPSSSSSRTRSGPATSIGTPRCCLDKLTFNIAATSTPPTSAFEAGEGEDGHHAVRPVRHRRCQWPSTRTRTPSCRSWGRTTSSSACRTGPAGRGTREPEAAPGDLARDRPGARSTTRSTTAPAPTSTGITPPGIPGFRRSSATTAATTLDKAKDLFEEWQADGGSLDEPIKIQFNAGAGHEDVVAIIQSNLKALGIETEQDAGPRRPTSTTMSRRRLHLLPGRLVLGLPDLRQRHVRPVPRRSAGNNLGKYDSAEFDDLVAEARATIDDDARLALFDEAEKILLNDDAAVVPINWYNGRPGLRRQRDRNFGQEPLGWVRFGKHQRRRLTVIPLVKEGRTFRCDPARSPWRRRPSDTTRSEQGPVGFVSAEAHRAAGAHRVGALTLLFLLFFAAAGRPRELLTRRQRQDPDPETLEADREAATASTTRSRSSTCNY